MDNETIIAVAECISRLKLDAELRTIEMDALKGEIARLRKENEALKIELKEATTND